MSGLTRLSPRADAVEALLEQLKSRHQCIPVVATEIEWYTTGFDPGAPEDAGAFWTSVSESCQVHDIRLHAVSRERGVQQYECALYPAHHIADVIAHTYTLKNILTECAQSFGGGICYAAKPYPDQPGSGLHIHLHLETPDGKKLYHKQDDCISPYLTHSLSGLLTCLPATMLCFAPDDASYQRFIPKQDAPTTVSWGSNNRTVALRLPDKGTQERHIEHRVAGADAEVETVIVAMLAATLYGLEYTPTLDIPIYGDAGLPMYDLQPLPATKAHACNAWHEEEAIQEFFSTYLSFNVAES